MGSEAESESWLQHAEWIPESRGGLVLVKDNDIYYRSDHSWATWQYLTEEKMSLINYL